VDELRDRYGVNTEHVLPSLREFWDAGAEADLLGAMALRGVAPEAVRALHDWFVNDVFNGALGRLENVNLTELEQAFRARAENAGVPADLVENIVRAERERLGFLRSPISTASSRGRSTSSSRTRSTGIRKNPATMRSRPSSTVSPIRSARAC
jgi:hypothetical protein